MSDRPPGSRPAKRAASLTPQAAADRQARLEREAAALRANLRRRKAQARAREADDTDKPEPDTPQRS